MNKVIAIFLISLFMCANTSIGQLLKVPNLIEHYNEHKKEFTKTSISFIDFIKLHYSKNTNHNQEEHQNLPFKTFDNVTNVFLLDTFNSFQIQILKPLISSKKIFFYTKSFKSNLIASIWLPPKIV
jgi:SNF family Na+-dependent transporter